MPLDSETYVPRGSTALLDAIGRTIDELGKRLSETPEPMRPAKVLVAIMTDGLENASAHYSWRDISNRIKHQTEAYNWEFLFLGANQDAIATAANLNIDAAKAASYTGTVHGSMAAASAISRKTTSGRRVRWGFISEADAADSVAPMQQIVHEEDSKPGGAAKAQSEFKPAWRALRVERALA